jgi:hypothetical protein
MLLDEVYMLFCGVKRSLLHFMSVNLSFWGSLKSLGCSIYDLCCSEIIQHMVHERYSVHLKTSRHWIYVLWRV